MKIEPIGYIKTPFRDKFGIPRQSCMVNEVISFIELEEKYGNMTAFKEINGFSHIWVIWGFSKSFGNKWSPTVRPPRLGGNKRVGVFATRSPNRPNPLGLSSLKLLDVTQIKNKIILKVSGADMLNNSPIYDIKPYIPFTDVHTDATLGFTKDYLNYSLNVIFPNELQNKITDDKLEPIIKLLSLDPRPSYQNDSERIYGVTFYDYNLKFKVNEYNLSVIGVEKVTDN